MNEDNIFDNKKEINPFSDIEKTPIESQAKPVEQHAVVEEAPVQNSGADQEHKDETDLFLRSILNDGDNQTPATEPNAQPQANESATPEQNTSNELKNLIEMEEKENANVEPANNRTTIQDIVPSDKVTNFEPSDKGQKQGSNKKMLVLAGIVILVIVGAYFFSFNSNSQETESLTTNLETPTAQAFPNDTTRKSDLTKIKTALNQYKQAKGSYPVSAKTIFISEPGNIVSQSLVPTYLNILPTDPDSSRKYGYKSDGATFTLTAVFDNANDSSVVVENGLSLYKLTSQSEAGDDTLSEDSEAFSMENQGGDYVFEP